jgi:hypothetical protein
MFCRKCGNRLAPQAKFCKQCGNPVASAQRQPNLPPPPPPSARARPNVPPPRQPEPAGTFSFAPAPVPTPPSDPPRRAAVAPPPPPPSASVTSRTPAAVPGAIRTSRSPAIIVIALVVLAVAGGGYFLYLRHIDATIPAKLRAEFLQDQNLRNATIEVTSKNGVVYLSGFVATEADKANAVRIANAEAGVRSVVAAPLTTGNFLINAVEGKSPAPTPGTTETPPPTDGQPNQSTPPVLVPAPAKQNSSPKNDVEPPPPPPPPKQAPPAPPSIAQAVIQQGDTLKLAPGQMYLYGMVSGGAFGVSPFASGEFAQATNAVGQVCAALAYGADSQNSYTTKTGPHLIGGVSVSGTWDHMETYSASNSRAGAEIAAVSFPVTEDSLVVVIASAASERKVALFGTPGIQFQTDASSSGGVLPMVIGHAYLKPGKYTASETSSFVAGQDPRHMAQLIGVFVFGSHAGSPAAAIDPPATPLLQAQNAKGGNIHTVDFLNFDYPSDCSKEFDGFPRVIHVSDGSWRKENVGGFGVGQTRKKPSHWMIAYGDLKGDGQDQAAVVTGCQGMVNYEDDEVSVFQMSPAGPTLLAKLSPKDWGPGTNIYDVQAANRQLMVRYLDGGSHACPDTLVTAKFQWNVNRFTRTGSSSQPYNCQ